MSNLRVALFNIESYANAKAIREILENNRNLICAVVTSDLNRSGRKGIFRELLTNLRTSGVAFTIYLVTNFLLHSLMSSSSHLFAKIFRYNPPYKSLKGLCAELGIPYHKTTNVNDDATLEFLKNQNINLISIYYFDQILKDRIISFPSQGVVNFHAANLPHCKGLHPIFFSTLYNNGSYAVTAHEITDTRIDAGNILAQSEVQSFDGKHHLLALDEQVNLLGVELFRYVLTNYEKLKEDSAQQATGSYFSRPTKEEVRDFLKSGHKLVNFSKWVQSYF